MTRPSAFGPKCTQKLNRQSHTGTHKLLPMTHHNMPAFSPPKKTTTTLIEKKHTVYSIAEYKYTHTTVHNSCMLYTHNDDNERPGKRDVGSL